MLNLCANNYLGLAQHPKVRQAAHEALEHWGYGLASVRFICGTQGVHKELEDSLTDFLGTEDTILYGSCFDANGGLFETILGPEDAIISDELNHASIIDGIRLCKAARYRYKNCDMADLEAQLIAAGTDGEGAVRQWKRIATGWRLKAIAEPMIVRTGADTPEAIAAKKTVPEAQLVEAEELGMALASGLALGVF